MLNQLDDDGKNPLFVSIRHNNRKIALFLLQKGPAPNVLNAVAHSCGYLLLHVALLTAVIS